MFDLPRHFQLRSRFSVRDAGWLFEVFPKKVLFAQFLTAFHYILFMNSYAILITHLLYRYWVIRKWADRPLPSISFNFFQIRILLFMFRPYNIKLFSSPLFIAKLIAPVAAIGTILWVHSFEIRNISCKYFRMVLSFSVIEAEDSPLMQTIREEFRKKYNHTRNNGWVIADYWVWFPFFSIFYYI